ncbi:thiamine diphosphate-binding protein [Paraphysoderma sedebokerense]|nr:thiamine diphosphate-binding protein [Paraphysoderma sedebokerense]
MLSIAKHFHPIRSKYSVGVCTRIIDAPRRWYHETPHDVYGYRIPRPFELPDYTPEELQNRVENATLLRYVIACRTHGHKAAKLDPLGMDSKSVFAELDPARYGVIPGKSYNIKGILHVGKTTDPSVAREQASAETIMKHLQSCYSGRIAYEFTHIPNASERRWFAHMIESFEKKRFTSEEKRRMFSLLTKSEVFDTFMGKKFPQVKRYGLEGAESMMVALDSLFATSNSSGIVDAVVCMPHRGRLNLLTDLLQYNPTKLFHKVKGNPEYPPSEADLCTGDVISHLAQSVNLDYGHKKPLHVSLIHNPSHLEAVNPVAMGKARAKQMYLFELNSETDCYLGDRVACIQLHGDAAFTGQGVVMEAFGLSNLPHFTCGGSIHVIVNNQIGYTTPAINARSSVYTSDIGKMINCPVIHVNGDHPEDVAYAASLAWEYRNKFRKDVILDVITYRRWGHNELDEPAFTQPLMYQNIRSRKSVPKLYEEKLLNEQVLSSQTEVDEFRQKYYAKLDEHLSEVSSHKVEYNFLQGKWSKIASPKETVSKLDTGVSEETLLTVGKGSVASPQDFTVHPRLDKFHIQSRLSKLADGTKIDWATAEALAFGSLLLENYSVRICGQDVGRGTFSQRHVMLVDQQSEKTWVPLNALGDKQGKLEIANSSLSEFAVLGFEFGMSWETPNRLNIWEAQFGDFFNGAQVVIDTFISSTEAKWLRQSGLVMLLPHGYDGTGPEHSSCRIERFLQLTNDRFNVLQPEVPVNPNMHVVNPTTAAQYFHLLRRQMKRNFRKPLIVAAPKTLLRLSDAVSSIKDMAPGTTFQPVLGDQTISSPDSVKRIILVSGKLYYDLIKERSARSLDSDVAIVRIEELCPFPVDDIIQELKKYKNADKVVWCQEEPRNMGAWSFMEGRLELCLGRKVQYAGRVTAACPATGVSSVHRKEQAQLLKDAFA